jgi:hypothetical protein
MWQSVSNSPVNRGQMLLGLTPISTVDTEHKLRYSRSKYNIIWADRPDHHQNIDCTENNCDTVTNWHPGELQSNWHNHKRDSTGQSLKIPTQTEIT